MSPARHPARQPSKRPYITMQHRLQLSVFRGDGLHSSSMHTGAAIQGYKLRPKRKTLRRGLCLVAFLLLFFVTYYNFPSLVRFIPL